jgi:ATP-dependent helicase/nuclease subunit B
MTMPKPTLHFIGNDRSAPQQIVQWCLQQWPDTLPAGIVFCVPTALAMRRLRDALVKAYNVFHGIRFTQPAGLTAYFAQPHTSAIATASEQLCVWDRVFDWLAQADKDNLIAQWLFPGKNEWLARPAARYTVAQRFIKLRATLAEVCLDFGGVANHPQTQLLDARERGRWAALDALETQYREQLAAINLIDPTDLQLAIFREPKAVALEEQENWRLIVACVPDMMPALHALMEAAPQCDILVQATATEAERFTAYGTPDPAYWTQAQLSLPDTSIALAETPADEAAYIEHFLARTGIVNPHKICLGVLNREIMPTLTGSFATHGIHIFEPSPLPLSRQPATRILRDLFKLAATERIELVLPLLAIPEAVALVGSDYVTLRKAFVELIDKHRPATLREAHLFLKEDALEKLFLNRIEQWLAALRQNPSLGAKTVLTDLFGAQIIDPVKDATRFATFEALQQLFTEMNAIRVPEVTPSEALLMTRLSQTSIHPIRGTSETSYEGRFEILWSNAEQFVVAGLNEGIFPDTTFEDAFLPNAFRKTLGLRSDVNRIARDAYILETLCGRCAPENLCFTASRLNANAE